MRSPKTVLLPLTFLLPLLMLFACSNPLSPSVTAADNAQQRKILSNETDAFGTVHEIGVLGPGAQYEIWVPKDWAAGARGLVMYVHGYIAPQAPISLPRDLDSVIGIFLQQGFAVADSSYSQNGWAVKDGAIRTRQLRGYFEGDYGAPGKVYLIGVSEGGNIILKLVQQNPELFSGALAVSGVVGSAQMELSYILNERILFDYFFRDTLRSLKGASDPEVASVAKSLDEALGSSALDANPGNTGLPSDGAQFTGMVAKTVGTILAMNPAKTLALATMTVDGQPMFNWPEAMIGTQDFGTEMLITVALGLWFGIFGTQDMLDRTHEQVPVDTTSTLYASQSLTPEENLALNNGVERLVSFPAAVNYLTNWYQPTGSLQIPLVTLHTSRDPVVPIQQEYRLKQIVESSSADMLAQFAAEGFGHAQILMPPSYSTSDPAFGQQMMAAFGYLQAWVATGQKPSAQPFGLTPLP